MKKQDTDYIDDSFIKAKVGTKDPFLVPDGYFEGLTGQIMAALPPKPEVKSKPLVRSMPARWMAAASVACIIALGGYTFSQWQMEQNEESTEMAYENEDIDEALDYVMMTNNDIATYLTMGE